MPMFYGNCWLEFGEPRHSCLATPCNRVRKPAWSVRSEEHTSELQSRSDLVCRLLLEKKKKNRYQIENSSHRMTNPKTPLVRENPLHANFLPRRHDMDPQVCTNTPRQST